MAVRVARGPAWPVLLLTVLAGLVTACGPGQPSDAAPPGLPKFYDATQLLDVLTQRRTADPTAQLSVVGDVTGSVPVTFTAQGGLSLVGPTPALALDQTMTWPGAAPQQTGFVLRDGEVWLRTADGGTPWLRAGSATTQADRMRVAIADALGDATDPTANLSRYADATLVSDAADEVVDGVPTVRYTLVVDLTRASTIEPDPELKAQLDQQIRDGLTRITSTLWVDADTRPVRTQQRQGLADMGTLATTADYRSWGTSVTISPPPPAEVR
ncbi:hypothetical protein [Pseudonocardia sp. D17]|jgi:hypothetical protein|uniref:hypothetical protein n=1 Tax=Pseudonocardia sp. D17 TaxID=882661 RepID=UPI0030CDF8D3